MTLRALLLSTLVAFHATLAAAAQPADTEISELGVIVRTVTPLVMKAQGLAVSSGALIVAVVPNGAAAKAGLATGDIIVAAGADQIADAATLGTLMRRYDAGEAVRLTRIRGATDEREVVVTAARHAGPLGDKTIVKSAAPRPTATAPKPATRGFGQPKPPATTAPTESAAPPPAAAPGGTEPTIAFSVDESALYTPVDVFYATDRKGTGAADPATAYGGDRGDLVLGKCVVTIPKSHVEGAIEAPSLLRLEFSEDPAKHVILASLKPLSAADFYREAGAKIASDQSKSALVFVHGYNVTFRDAALRTAQMSYDLKFKGVPVFFSWPSQGKYLGYVRDESNIEYAKTDLKKFLKDFVANTPAERVYLVAHSMGNRAVTSVLADLFRDAPHLRAKFRDIILAAPDIDADIFKRDIAPAIVGPEQNITLYASSNDWALKASKTFHGYQRAGDTGENLTVVPGLVTIDSSSAETGFLGHSYFAESKSIIDDILGIFSGRPKPEERPPLIPAESAAGRYWKIP